MNEPLATKHTRSSAVFTRLIAKILRGHFTHSEYGWVVLPFVVLRRLDCLLEPNKAAVFAQALPAGLDEATRDLLPTRRPAAVRGSTANRFTISSLKGQEPPNSSTTSSQYVATFSSGAREISLDRFWSREVLKRLNDAGVL